MDQFEATKLRNLSGFKNCMDFLDTDMRNFPVREQMEECAQTAPERYRESILGGLIPSSTKPVWRKFTGAVK